MKVFTEITDLLGKKAFQDSRLMRLAGKFNSEKTTFYTLEFTNQKRDLCDCIVSKEEKTLDFIVEDLEKAETLGAKPGKAQLAVKVLDILNRGKFLSEELSQEESFSLREYAFVSLKPIIFWRPSEANTLYEEIFRKSASIFFFTTVKKEARAWLIKKNTDVVQAAGKIHTDLAKGFIRAEVYNVNDLENFKNIEEARQKGILKVVDKNYVVEDGDVVDIKFNINR